MSLINYEHVGRQVKASNQQHHHQQQQQQQHNHNIRASSSNRTRNKQRKWRVLLSIGLLLPTLAAIIGIVAWAISIEVANTSQSSPQLSALTSAGGLSSGASSSSINSNSISPNSNRKLHHHNHHHHYNQQQQQDTSNVAASSKASYHQFRRQNSATTPTGGQSGAQAAAAAAANEIISREDDQSSNINDQTRSNPPNSEQQPKLIIGTSAAELESSEGTRALGRPVAPATIGAGSGSGRAQVNRRRAPSSVANNLPAAGDQKTKSESASNDKRSSTLLLTTVGQIEELRNKQPAKDTKQQPQMSSGQNDDSTNANDDNNSSIGNDAEEQQQQQQKSKVQQADEPEERSKEQQTDTTTTTITPNNVEDKQEAQEEEEARIKQRDEPDNSKNSSRNKSTSMNGGSKLAKKSKPNPISSEDKSKNSEATGEKETLNLEDNQSASKLNDAINQVNNIKLIESAVAKILMAKGLEPNNRYTIVNKGEFEANDEMTNVESMGSEENGKRSKADRSDRPANIERNQQQDQESFSDGKKSGRIAASKAQQALFGRPEDEQRNRYLPSSQKADDQQQQQQRDDELSFEAIASAISTTLNANAAAQQADGDDQSSRADATSSLADNQQGSGSSSSEMGDSEELTELTEGGESSALSANDGRETSGAQTRRRTPGEHVAEVIDHIVERRKQSSGMPISGPQIVVVAPVGGSQMKARSLTKETTTATSVKAAASSTGGMQKKPMSEDKRAFAKKETITTGFMNDKKPRTRASKPLAARLLGVAGEDGKLNFGDKTTAGGNNKQFSERVEVIEDDDSSAFLYKNPNDMNAAAAHDDNDDDDNSRSSSRLNSDDSFEENVRRVDHISPAAAGAETEFGGDKSLLTLEQLLDDQPASIHVSNQPKEPRLRSPRNGNPIGLAFERYAPVVQSDNQGSKLSLVNTQQQQQQQAAIPIGSSGPRIYSAEKLILDHVLKSKQPLVAGGDTMVAAASEASSDIKRSGNGGNMESMTGTRNHMHQPKKPQQQQHQHQHQQTGKQVKVAPTTVRPHHSSTVSTDSASESGSNKELRAHDSRQEPRGPNDQLQTIATNEQAIQVPVYMAQNHHIHLQHQHQSVARPETYQSASAAPTESQQNYPPHQAQPHSSHQNHRYQQQPSYQNQPETLQQASSEGQQQQQYEASAPVAAASSADRHSLPTFADQEFNVPAHMAESVIQNIQMSPVTFNMVNGRPTLVGGMGQQVPSSSSSSSSYQPSYQNSHPNSQSSSNFHQQQQYLQQYQNQNPMAASELQPIYQQYQNWQQQMVANNRFQPQQQQQQQQYSQFQYSPLTHLQRQSLSDRSTKTITLTPSKGALVHPVAQLAIRHLLGSLARQKPVQVSSRQESPVAAAAAASGSPSTQVSSRSSILELQKSGPTSSQHYQADTNGPLQPSDSMQTAGSSVFPQVNNEQQQQQQQPSMNSITINNRDLQAALTPATQRETATQDQDMEESYGQVPTYHMAPRAPHYGGGQHYEGGDHDKKSKGITFHFGGGPIGGGTQLITSPMGIFKHLMIPLLPNPRVNLNGKVVFGVVLEKSTAIGGEPKKKFKFWGR